MLKLFKYNWKLSSTGFFITMVAVVLLYGMLLLGEFQWGWHDEFIFILGVMVSLFSVLILIGIVCVNFNHGMKSYHRRLLPVSPFAEMGSTLLLSIIYALTTVSLSFIYLFIVYKNLNYERLMVVMSGLFTPKSVIAIFLYAVWCTIMLMTLLMLSIAASYCFRGRYRAWIGVVVFIATATITDFVCTKIAGPSYGKYFSFVEFKYEPTGSASDGLEYMSYTTFHFWALPFLIELVAVGVQVGIAYYLIKRRIQL